MKCPVCGSSSREVNNAYVDGKGNRIMPNNKDRVYAGFMFICQNNHKYGYAEEITQEKTHEK